MYQARFYLIAIALHLALLYCLVESAASSAPEAKPKYVDVTLAMSEPEPPPPQSTPPEISPDPADQAGVQLIEQAFTPESPPPSLEPDLPPPEPPPPASASESAPIISEQAPEVTAPPARVPSPAGSKPNNAPGPVPKINSAIKGAPNGTGNRNGGALPFGGNPHYHDQGSGHYYVAIYAPNGITWLNAQKDAILHGGYLATITTDAENKHIFNLINDPKYWRTNSANNSLGPWIGGYKSIFGLGWHWVDDGSEPNFALSRWARREPDNTGGNQDHLHYYSWNPDDRQPTWDDQSGNDIMNGYVVEYNSDPATLKLEPDAANGYLDPAGQQLRR